MLNCEHSLSGRAVSSRSRDWAPRVTAGPRRSTIRPLWPSKAPLRRSVQKRVSQARTGTRLSSFAHWRSARRGCVSLRLAVLSPAERQTRCAKCACGSHLRMDRGPHNTVFPGHLHRSAIKHFAFSERYKRIDSKRLDSRRRSMFAVGTRVTSRPPHRSVRAQFGHTACMGLFLSTEFQRRTTFSSFLRFLGSYS